MKLEEPKYTQVPNALFDDMASMTEAELRCTLIIVRKIIGFHKEGPEPISYSQLVKLTGLSRQSVASGIKAARQRGTVRIAGHGKRGVNLFTLAFTTDDQSTKLTSQEGDQSNDLTSTSQEGRPELVNLVDTQKKVFKETPLKKGDHSTAQNAVEGASAPADPPPSPQPKNKSTVVSTHRMNPMKDALVSAFGWSWAGNTPMTATEKGTIQKAARELCLAKVEPSDIPGLYGYCQSKFDHFTPMALSKNLSDFRKTSKPTAANDHGLATAYKRARSDCPQCDGKGVIKREGALVECDCAQAKEVVS